MSIHKRALLGVFVIFSVFLASCRGEAQEPTPTQMDPGMVLTAAAVTAEARMTSQALTPIPTRTSTSTPATRLTLTPPGSGSTLPVTTSGSPTVTAVVGGTDKAEFVADVTVPDGTVFAPGASFVKTWRLKNTGTSTWTPAYSLVFFSGNQMSGAASSPLPSNIPPGGTADISVDLTAPSAVGNYFGFWMLRNPAQRNFGVGPGSDQPFYVEINVQGSGTPGTPGPTTPPVSGGSTVTDVSLAVDAASYEGACPHTFNFIAKFTLTKPATVSYRLEADTGFQITLPPPTTSSLDAGTYTLNYNLEFSNSFTGWVQFHVTAPEDVTSSRANITLRCQ